MNKQVLKIFSMLSLVVILATVAVYANSAGSMVVNIPFDFSAENKTLPAGAYTVERATPLGMLLIRRRDSREGVMITTQSVEALNAQDQSKLVFHRYGDRYFLAQVWTAGDSTGREVWKSRAERELINSRSKYLAKNAVGPEVVCVVAQ